MDTDPYGLDRFVAAQEGVHAQALGELRAGRKTSHWMWFVFPQVAGLGSSAMAQRYAIGSLAEARAYLAHPVLGPRLTECVEAVLSHTDTTAHDILGSPDDVKLRSSMTLFALAAGPDAPFQRVLDAFFDGEADPRTVDRVREVPSTSPGTNWAGNHTYTAGRYVRARSLEEAQEVVRASRHVRMLGTRHSFNALCDTEGTLLDLTGLATEPVLDAERGTVRVAGQTPYNDVAAHLQAHGHALANLGSLPHISVAGATSTGTHGSGAANRILGAGVSRLELIGPDGELRTLARGEPDFDGSVVALGALGAVVSLDLDVEPTYDVRQDLFAHLRWSEVVERIDQVLGSAYSVSVFGRWSDADPTEVLVKTRTTDDRGPADWIGETEAVPATTASLTLGAGDHLTVRGEAGPWSDRLPHFRGDRQPSFGAEIQSEWFVPAASAEGALRAVTDLAAATGGELADLLIVSEIRAIRADDLWLSPAEGRETVALHFTWKREPAAVLAMVRRVEDALAPFAPRPHWGKVYDRVEPAHHPRLGDFRALVDRVDPAGTFRNAMVDRVLGAG